MRILPISAALAASLIFLAACSKGESGAHEATAPQAAAGGCQASADGAVTAQGAAMREQLDTEAMSAAYFTICNGTMAAVTLDEVTTPVANDVELHETNRDENGRVSMAPLGTLTLQPGEQVVFKPGGKHAMLMDLQQALKSGETEKLTLHFSNGADVTLDAPVMSPPEMATQMH